MKPVSYPMRYVTSIAASIWIILIGSNRLFEGSLSGFSLVLMIFGITVFISIGIVDIVKLIKWRRQSWHPGPRLY